MSDCLNLLFLELLLKLKMYLSAILTCGGVTVRRPDLSPKVVGNVTDGEDWSVLQSHW